MNPEFVGLAAGILTTLSFLPQVIRIFKTQSTKDISLSMYLIFCTGVCLWFAYGLLINSWAILIANGMTIILSGIVLVMKIRLKDQ
jgi:MtN3 and saliva related transmembrane protein